MEFNLKSVHGKDSLSPYVWIKTGTEQKYADVGLSYGWLFLMLSSYVYELNLAQVFFLQHMFIQYMMGTQNFLVFISFCRFWL